MPAYSGKCQYQGERGETLSQGPCQIKFEKETCIATPSGGIPIAFDLGDVESVSRGEWDMQLTLFTGKTLALRQFGPAFGRMADELTAAWRDRTVQCLLLEDLEELGRFQGSVALAPSSDGPLPAEIRIYKSNIAVLPIAGAAVQWRLADVDAIDFDERSYSTTLVSEARKLVFTKLAKKTDEFVSTLRGALDEFRERSAEALHQTFPFLDPDRLQRLLTTMPEGRSATIASLAQIHPKLPDALIARAVAPHLKPYFDALRSRAGSGALMAGFKFIRPDEEEQSPAEEAPPEAESEQPVDAAVASEPAQTESPLFFWFFFPLGKVVAWESTTGTGRATYFFRLAPRETNPAGVEAAVARFTRGLALVNFRREPVHLPDDALEQQERFHRYAIGARKLPDLRALRAAFAGRAIHSTVEKWSAQVDAAVK